MYIILSMYWHLFIYHLHDSDDRNIDNEMPQGVVITECPKEVAIPSSACEREFPRRFKDYLPSFESAKSTKGIPLSPLSNDGPKSWLGKAISYTLDLNSSFYRAPSTNELY